MLIRTVTQTIDNNNMINPGDRVIAALSGGADSVCMLHVLKSLKADLGFTLEAVHINHCIRGDESDEDEQFCIHLCSLLEIPLETHRIDIPMLMKSSGKSMEETARDARYEIFAEYSDGNVKIATAHTLSDNAETVLFNIIRGTGIRGICGIPCKRDNIIRPLIEVTREQVEGYLDSISQDFRTDSTNLSDDYTRNKIRHKIIPVMLEINSSFFRSFANGQKAVKEENDFLELMAQNAYDEHFSDNCLNGLSELPQAVRKRVISRYLSLNNLPVSYDKINEVNKLCDTDGKLNISKGVFIKGKNGCISVELQNPSPVLLETPLKTGLNRIFEDRSFFAFKSRDGENLIDMDKVSGEIILRNRRFGDRIKLSGRSFTSSVKKLLNEKVPPEKRPFVHFLSDDEGVIFMEGFGVAERVMPDNMSQNILSVGTEKGIDCDNGGN